MKKLYEYLKCSVCETEFEGRKPSESAEPICPKCQLEDALVELKANEPIPETVNEETSQQRRYD